MSRIKQGIFFISISLLTGSTQLYAAEHEHEEHGAHVHGEAQLLIALEGSTLEIEFLSPAMNIVGFEHQSTNEAQSHAIESAIEALKQPGLLFSLPPAAKCDSVSIEVESPLKEHGEQDHEHSNEASLDLEEVTHVDFTGHYSFHCAEMSKLDSIVIEIFNQFPGTEVIGVQSVSNQGQQKIELTPDHSTLEL
ncbi:MAG: DUF2796 domain-containing protein [Gammaproteobacteria bacterium]|nr:DUF2796 domain-containing protein [Gammaproteobacteria bacterium]